MIDRILLFPYFLTLKMRHFLYDKGFILKSRRAEVPTICVGNVTVGGTGKTPHTEMILDTLLQSADWGQSDVAVLSRGYKRRGGRFQQVTADGTASMYGDEPLQIKKKFPVVTVAVDKSRTEGCDLLCHPEKLAGSRKYRKVIAPSFPAADLIVLDDAFQHRALKADVDIVLVDYNRPATSDMLLPLGRLRDLPERIAQADIVIVTKCPGYLSDLEKESFAVSLGVSGYTTTGFSATSRTGKQQKLYFTKVDYLAPEAVYEEGDPRYVYSKKLVLFSGIANDLPLRMFLSDNYKIVKRFCFPDHHKYSLHDIRTISSAAKLWPTAVLATTQKDAQRVLDCKKVPSEIRKRLFTVPIKAEFLSEAERISFTETLLERIRRS